MLNKHKRLSAGMAALVLGLGAAGLATADNQNPSPAGPVQCEILTTPANGRVTLEGVVHTQYEINGSYSFQVASTGRSGNSNIQQGGYFAAGPSGPVTLGQVMLSSQGAIYDATLEIIANGASIACATRVENTI